MSDVIRLKGSMCVSLEEYRSNKIKIFDLLAKDGFKACENDLERYVNMSLSELLENALFDINLELRRDIKDMGIE